ncbi:hypothetical protein C5167_034032 [Papaver somniferum]|uniref:Uncharacterized protein n=1 Tax=Papaver somniferum TaxID=3469 RepID=A0A4Y7KG65_PAPSO|nr:hypothetical protein C5167_034032 [Papaver somniferum]
MATAAAHNHISDHHQQNHPIADKQKPSQPCNFIPPEFILDSNQIFTLPDQDQIRHQLICSFKFYLTQATTISAIPALTISANGSRQNHQLQSNISATLATATATSTHCSPIHPTRTMAASLPTLPNSVQPDTQSSSSLHNNCTSNTTLVPCPTSQALCLTAPPKLISCNIHPFHAFIQLSVPS